MADRTSPGRRHLIISTAGRIGGSERVVLTVAAGLERLGVAVDAVFPDTHERAAFLEWSARSDFPAAEVTTEIADVGAPHGLRTSVALAKFVRARRPSSINIHFGDSFMSIKDVAALRLACPRTRLVATVHHPTDWAQSGWRKRVFTALSGLLVNAVIVPSDATAAIVRAAPVRARKIEVIPNGIHIDPQPIDRRTARAAFGLDVDDVAVVSLGRLLPHKGMEELIQAFDDAGAADAVLLIAGEGPELGHLERLAAGCDTARIRLLGRVPDVDQLLAAADVFALASHLEGFGLVYLEAAAFSVASIGCDVGGVSEVIDDEVTGLLVPAGDVTAISAALRRLIDDPDLRQRFGAAARDRLVTYFGEDTMALRYRASTVR